MKNQLLNLCAAATVLLYSCGGSGNTSTTDTTNTQQNNIAAQVNTNCTLPNPCNACEPSCQDAAICIHKIKQSTFDSMRINKEATNEGTIITADAMKKKLSTCDVNKPVYILVVDTTQNTDNDISVSVVAENSTSTIYTVGVMYKEALIRGLLRKSAKAFHFYNAKRLAEPYDDDIIFRVSFPNGVPDEYYDLSDAPPPPPSHNP